MPESEFSLFEFHPHPHGDANSGHVIVRKRIRPGGFLSFLPPFEFRRELSDGFVLMWMISWANSHHNRKMPLWGFVLLMTSHFSLQSSPGGRI